MKGYKAIYNVQKRAKSSKIVKKLPNTELNFTKYKQGFYYLQDSQCFADYVWLHLFNAFKIQASSRAHMLANIN